MFKATFNHSGVLNRLLTAVLFCVSCNYIFGQNFISNDSLFQAARNAAFQEKDYVQAKNYCSKILLSDARYVDAQLFLGKIYAWTKQYDSARIWLQQSVITKPDYEDAALAYADVEYWTSNNEHALQIVNDALGYHPQSSELLLRKAKVLTALREYTEANTIVSELVQKDKMNQEARALSDILKDKSALNKVGVIYDYVYFDKQFPDPWHLVSFDYTRRTKLANITGRVNYASRFGKNGLQYEAEAYPHISKTVYAYAQVAYSDEASVFPRWRSSVSLYSTLPAAFELELGWRYFYFSSATNIVTGSLSKYYKNYLFGVRTFVAPFNNHLSSSYNVYARFYFGGANDFIGLTAGTGISPDERSIYQQLNSTGKPRSYTTAVELRHVVKTLNIIGVNAWLINHEYLPKTKGNEVQVGVRYERRF